MRHVMAVGLRTSPVLAEPAYSILSQESTRLQPVACCPMVTCQKHLFKKVPHRGEPEWSLEAVQAIHKENVKSYLPAWSYDAETMSHPQASFPGNGTRTAKILGLCALGLTWVPFFVTSSIVYLTFECHDAGLPAWWLWTYGLSVFMVLCMEWRTFKYLIVFQAIRTYPFEVRIPLLSYCGEGPWHVNFGCWLALTCPWSLVAHFELFTTASSTIEGLGLIMCDDTGRFNTLGFYLPWQWADSVHPGAACHS